MRRVFAVLAGATTIGLALSGCADSASDDPQSAVPKAQANAASSTACAPFPADLIPPDPVPPFAPPYGDPQQPASLVATQQAVVSAAQGSEYSKSATMCAEGMTEVAVCDVDYWNVGGLPGKEEDCNFFYMRVGNEYWTGLTPMVLAQYGGYLGVSADGKDPANQNAGPHTTVAEYSGGWVNVGPKGSTAANFAVQGGKLTAGDVAAQLQQAVRGAVTSPYGQSSVISPILASTEMAVDCSTAWLNANNAWQQTTIDAINPTAKTAFACSATGPGVGTAYIEAMLPGADPAATSVPAAVSVKVTSDQTNTLRRDPAAGFTSANVVWPTGTDEVTTGKSIPFTIESGNVCENDAGTGKESCLHLWVNFPNNSAQSVGPANVSSIDEESVTAVGSEAEAAALQSSSSGIACNIWFTLELDSPELLATMAKYGLSTQDYTPHISLAKKKWKTTEVGAPSGTAVGKPDPCNDARLIALGQPGVDPFNPNPAS